MDWSLILDYTLKIVGTAAGTIVVTLATILFTKLKNKIGEAKLNIFIDKCVKAAEQLFPNLGNKTGKQKYEYVLNTVKEKYPNLSNEYLKPLIEGAVYAVSEQLKQLSQEHTYSTSGNNTDSASVGKLTIG